MEVRKITQKELAQKSGYSEATISSWLSGRHIPRLDSAKRVAQRAGVPIDIFLSRAVQKLYLGRVYLKEEKRRK